MALRSERDVQSGLLGIMRGGGMGRKEFSRADSAVQIAIIGFWGLAKWE